MRAPVLEKYHMTFGAAESLRPFPEYAFFTPALLYLFGRFTDQPLAGFLSSDPEFRDIRYLYHRFERPVFQGMRSATGNTDWNHVLWAIEARAWPAFESWIVSSMLVDHPTRSFYRMAAQEVAIRDPLVADRRRVLVLDHPTMSVTVFGVIGNNGIIAINHADLLGALRPPRVRYYAADATIRRAAHQVASEDLATAADTLTGALAGVAGVEGDLPALEPFRIGGDIADAPHQARASYERSLDLYRRSVL